MTAVALNDVERRVLGHLPVWRNEEDLAEAIRLETEGHSEKEIAAIKAKPTSKSDLKELGLEDDYIARVLDPREGTDDDPRIIKGVGHSIQSYTAEQMFDRLRRDEHLPLYLAKQVIGEGAEPRPLDVELVMDELGKLKARGLADSDGDGPIANWTMTEAGRDSLTYNGDEPLT